MSIKKVSSIIFVVILLSALCFSPSYASSYIWSNSSEFLETASEGNSTDLNLQSGGAILIEQTTGTVLYEHNSHEMFRPASVTKVMSLLLIMEALDNRRNFFKRPCSLF